MLLSEVADKLYVDKNIINSQESSGPVSVFEKNYKFYLVEGHSAVLEYLLDNSKDCEVMEQHVFRFKRSDFVLLSRVPHRVTDI